MFQLRTYTLASEEATKTYLDIHWARHLKSLSKYGIKVHGHERKPGQNHPY